MSDLIERDKAIDAIRNHIKDIDGDDDALDYIATNMLKDVPSARPRGEWIGYNADKGSDWLRSDGKPIFLVCNKCHGTVMNSTSAHWNFCPNCGSDNREREGE